MKAYTIRQPVKLYFWLRLGGLLCDLMLPGSRTFAEGFCRLTNDKKVSLKRAGCQLCEPDR